MPPLDQILTPEKALIFRITHRDNVRWLLQNGLHAQSSDVLDPNFVTIGNPDLIVHRLHREVDIPPGGTLADYVPFYFTPCSPMLYNINTGYGNIRRRRNEEIVILVSSLCELRKHDVPFVYTDRHAYLHTARFFDDPATLGSVVAYEFLQHRDFRRDPERPDKMERYQAEALAYRHVPVEALLGVGCYTLDVKADLESISADAGAGVTVVHRRDWYF